MTKWLPPILVTDAPHLGGLGLRCYWCKGKYKGGLGGWQFADGLFLLCYMCAARILAACNGASYEECGIELVP